MTKIKFVVNILESFSGSYVKHTSTKEYMKRKKCLKFELQSFSTQTFLQTKVMKSEYLHSAISPTALPFPSCYYYSPACPSMNEEERLVEAGGLCDELKHP